jgi:hypothetical protein
VNVRCSVLYSITIFRPGRYENKIIFQKSFILKCLVKFQFIVAKKIKKQIIFISLLGPVINNYALWCPQVACIISFVVVFFFK